jgi:hypothetical protein
MGRTRSVDRLRQNSGTAIQVVTGDAFELAELVNQVVVSAAIGDSPGRFPELLDGAEAWVCDMTLVLRRRRGWESKATTTKVPPTHNSIRRSTPPKCSDVELTRVPGPVK